MSKHNGAIDFEEEEHDEDFVPEDDDDDENDDQIVDGEEDDEENDAAAPATAQGEAEETTMDEKIAKILQNKPVAPNTSLANKNDDLIYDLGNLSALDTHDIDMQQYKYVKNCAIIFSRQAKSQYLVSVSRENVQLLIEKIFALPSQGEDEGLFVEMPDIKTKLPREKPAPKPAAPSRFEQFKKDKGLKMREKEKLVYDDATDTYKPRAGRGRANDLDTQIMIPAKDSDGMLYVVVVVIHVSSGKGSLLGSQRKAQGKIIQAKGTRIVQ